MTKRNTNNNQSLIRRNKDVKIKGLFLGITLCVFFVACGGGGGGSDKETPAPQEFPKLTFSSTIDDKEYVQNQAIERFNLPGATGGTGDLIYLFSTSLPDGLKFIPRTRELRGTPTTPGRTRVTYMAVGEDNVTGSRVTGSLEFFIEVEEDVEPTFGRQGVRIPRVSVGEVINQVLPESTDGNGNLIYNVISLPEGLEFDSSTRVLSGTPTAPGRTLVTYMVTDADGDRASPLYFFIEVVGNAPSFEGRTVSVQQYTQNLEIAPVTLPHAVGRDRPITYGLAPTDDPEGMLPDGLIFNSNSLVLIGAPTAPGTTEMTYTARDAVTLTFNIVVRMPVMPVSSSNICSRTPQVRDAILAEIHKTDSTVSCSTVTPEHLAGITGKLDLDTKGINSLQTDDFAGLSSLSHLDLGNNSLTTLPSGVFEGLSSLEQLYLYSNDLTIIPSDLFYGLSKLRALYLYDNALTIIPSDIFAGLSSLSTLELNVNSLTTLHEDLFAGLSSLSWLGLSGNSLTTLHEDVFAGLSSLSILDLGYNDLTTLHENLFEGVSNLRTLGLSGNSLTTLHENLFEGVSNLRTLRLSGNSLTTLHEDLFAGLSSLNTLNLDGNDLTELPADVFAGLSSLTFIDISNELTEIPEELFNGLSNLETLWMYTTSPTLPADLFYGLSNLKNLRMRNIPLTDLPDDLFDGLLMLEILDMRAIPLTLLRDHQNMFDGLSSLTTLYISYKNSQNCVYEGCILTPQNELPSICQEETVTCRPL